MKEPTMEEVLERVTFKRYTNGTLYVISVRGNVRGNVLGYVSGSVEGSVGGSVGGNVCGGVEGTINGRKWQFAETPKEKAIRLIREGRGDEAIQVLQEVE